MNTDNYAHGKWWVELPGQLMRGEQTSSGMDGRYAAVLLDFDVSREWNHDVRLFNTIECPHEFDSANPPSDAFESKRWCVVVSRR